MKQHNPMKYIYHLVVRDADHPKPCHGWHVRAKRMADTKNHGKNEMMDINRFFAFKKYGGKYAALRKALRWRERNIPKEWYA